jgi:hypothetical protein
MSSKSENNHEVTWAVRVRECMTRATGAAWELGDLLIESRAFDGTCRKAAALTGYSHTHCLTLRRVAELFPAGLRSARISWGAHSLIAQVQDVDARHALLAMASADAWQQRDVREWLQEHGHIKDRTRDAAGDARGRIKHARPTQLVHVQCPECSHVFTVKGHKVKRPSVPTSATDEAATA